MTIKIFSFFSLFFIFISCKKTIPNATKEQPIEIVTENSISKLKYVEYALSLENRKVVEDWSVYNELEGIINNIKKGDLSFFHNNNDAVKLLIKNLKENKPKQIKTAAISSRILVLETKLLKLESLSNLSTTSEDTLLNTIKEVLVAFTNINFQMNKKTEFDNQTITKP